MTNEELKKKIVEILEETEYEWTEEKGGYISQIFYDSLADALIAAGIGDVKELFLDKKAYEAASNHYRILFEEWQRRAKIAERALKIAEELGELCAPAKDYIKQAEKELAEEINGIR